MASEELLAYYARRAHEYEQIYEKPERQADLTRLRSWLRMCSPDTASSKLPVAPATGPPSSRRWRQQSLPRTPARRYSRWRATSPTRRTGCASRWPMPTRSVTCPATSRLDLPPSGGRICRANASQRFFTASTVGWASGPPWCWWTTASWRTAAPRSLGGMPTETRTSSGDWQTARSMRCGKELPHDGRARGRVGADRPRSESDGVRVLLGCVLSRRFG